MPKWSAMRLNYLRLPASPKTRCSAALLFVRVLSGLLFWQHGLEKLFGFAGARPEPRYGPSAASAVSLKRSADRYWRSGCSRGRWRSS